MQVSINSPGSLLASFTSGNDTGRLIIVSGPSGSGKTRWCQELAGQANPLGIHAGGLVSPAVFEGKKKTGIDLLDLSSGIKKVLAVNGGNPGSGPVIGKWHFDEDTLKWGNTILAHSAEYPLLIVDELGPLELERGVGLTGGIELVARRSYRLACVVVRPSLLEAARLLWPWGETLFVPNSHSSEAAA